MTRILLVEDDVAISSILERAFEREGMKVEAVGDGEAALKSFHSSGSFDLVLLDIMLPDTNGIAVCQTLRKSSDVPIVMLTARSGEESVVMGLEVGADDYIKKPVGPTEVVSRVRAHLRRRRMDGRASDRKLTFPGLVIDPVRRQVSVHENLIDLTATEFEILSFLAASPGRVYNRDQIMQHLWDGEFYGEPRTADVHVQHIRKKIEADPKNPTYIKTVRGIGFKFADF